MRLNEAYSFPDGILAAIRTYDPHIRIRWGRAERCVRVERKVRRGRDVDPASCRGHDDYEAAREGYACVYKCHPHQAAQLPAVMAAGDLWRRGGARRVANDLDAADRAADERSKRRTDDLTEAWAKDLYRHINTPKTVPEGAGHRAYRGSGRGERLE